MKLSRVGEFGAIDRIKGLCRKPGREVLAGIGDDAAAYRAGDGLLTLATTDMLVEGVHFDLSYTGFWELGYKALAVNLSDIAAMGGRPRYYLVSMALREDLEIRDVEELYRGMESAAGPQKVRAIGGDTCGSPGPMVVSVTVLGEARPGTAVRRSGARPGDDIYVTGSLGDSAGGLELLKSGAVKFADFHSAMQRPQSARGTAASYLVAQHLMPASRVEAGMLLADKGLATSMVDISDGLSSDLTHILEQSRTGAVIYTENLPVSSELMSVFGRDRAVGFALHGGEDYELLFTAGRDQRVKVKGSARRLGTAITLVGAITKGKGAFLVSRDGKRTALRPEGYEHFVR